ATVHNVPQYLNWSKQAITWDRRYHPKVIPELGKYALVVDPIIDGYKFSKVLMDGGSSINILYLETLDKMKITEDQLQKSSTTFHGIVLGRQTNSLGKITLKVVFDDQDNFLTEAITFEVVPFKSAYHAVFGRPAFTRFMARP
ncbi:retroviral-like aspartic protease, partial [Streptomyces albiflaviniger]|nr:retroviral-like aspartic protease [Streptomyces albiflaviniger]